MNGLGLEAWLDRLLAASGYRGPVVVATVAVRVRSMEEDGSRVPDPHAWQDPGNGALYARAIAAGLSQADPAGKAAYDRNARAYAAAILSLDGRVRAEIEKVPAAKRKVVTSHDAFGYFGQAYGVEFLAAQGTAEDAEPSARDLRAADRPDPPGADQGGVPRERAEPTSGEQIARRDRCPHRRHAAMPTRSRARTGPPRPISACSSTMRGC